MADSKAPATTTKKTSSLDSSFPVLVPHHEALFYAPEKYNAWLKSALFSPTPKPADKTDGTATDIDLVSSVGEPTATSSTTAADDFSVIGSDEGNDDNSVPTKAVKKLRIDDDGAEEKKKKKDDPKRSNAFVQALLAEARKNPVLAPDNLTLTDNGALTYASTLEASVDLFSELHSQIPSARLHDLLNQAWAGDKLETLKIIFHCRSIPLGKGEQQNFYRACGWLASNAGPVGRATLLANLAVIADRTIVKPKKKVDDKDKKEGEAGADKMDIDQPEAEKKDDDAFIKEGTETKEDAEPEVPTMSHGYWKDLLNLVLLAAKDKLSVFADVSTDIYTPSRKAERKKLAAQGIKTKTKVDKSIPEKTDEQKKAEMKATRHELERTRHASFLSKWSDDADDKFYQLLHLTVARIFAAQLEADIKALREGSDDDKKSISFAGKWAPSLEGLHDKSTFIASTIAELLFPPHHPLVADAKGADRETYLKHAREAYRKHYLSPLRAHRNIVERDLTAGTFDKIKYNRVPSVAMTNYRGTFIKKDPQRFTKYLEAVALGKTTISGAALTPASLVARQRALSRITDGPEKDVERMVLDGQWASLLASVRDAGVLSNCMAVVDVSGSMESPMTKDGTCPMDAAIGFGMLISFLAEEPFRNLMITFSATPELMEITSEAAHNDGKWDFYAQVEFIRRLPWGMNTDFLAVFEKLLLPLCVKNQVPKEDMVKQLFVFSDMQFDAAMESNSYYGGNNVPRWETVYERVVRKYKGAGYEVPTIVFWDLAANGTGKPVRAGQPGAVLMAGMGAGTLKGFLQAGLGEVVEEEEETKEEEEGEDGDGEEKEVKKKRKAGGEEEEAKGVVSAGVAMRKVLGAEAFGRLVVVEK